MLGTTILLMPAYEDWRGTVDFIAANESNGDALFMHRSWYGPFALDYYYEGKIGPEQINNGDRQIGERVGAYPAGTTVWVVANNTPAEAARVSQIWAAFEANGSRTAEATFSRLLIVRAYEIR